MQSARAASSVSNRCTRATMRSEEHTSELQSRLHLVCRLLLEKKKKTKADGRPNTGAPRRKPFPTDLARGQQRHDLRNLTQAGTSPWDLSHSGAYVRHVTPVG